MRHKLFVRRATQLVSFLTRLESSADLDLEEQVHTIFLHGIQSYNIVYCMLCHDLQYYCNVEKLCSFLYVLKKEHSKH